MQTGYAILLDGKIDLRTVSDTERAAKVNGLVTIYRLLVMNNATDRDIAQAWDRRPEPGRTEVVPVRVAVQTQ
jgi:hypothetical protein